MTVISRLKLDHPDLATTGGAALHTSVNDMYEKIGDNEVGRYFEKDALALAASQDFEHNFKVSFDDLQIILYSRVVGSGELTTLTGATSPASTDFTIIATPGLETTSLRITNDSGAATEDISLVVIQNGGGGSGGGGGGGLQWNPVQGSAPIADEENNELVYKFAPGLSQLLSVFLKVPSGYAAGLPAKMSLGLYSIAAVNTVLLSATSYLIRKNQDPVFSTINSHASTNTAITNTVSHQYREIEIDLSTATGEINSISLSPGDMIRVDLTRGTDTDTEDTRLIPSATEATFI